MKTANIISENLRVAETGLEWAEKLTNATGTLHLLIAQTFRVRATGATIVTIDGVLAMTMSAGEIAIFNAGHGSPDDTSPWINVVISGAAAFVRVAQESERQRLTVNPYNQLNEPVGTGETP